MKIYLAYNYALYEMPCEPMVAFTARADAEAFCERCREHDRKEPKPPEEYDEAACKRWSKRHDAWRKRHPGKLPYPPAGYDVQEIELREARPDAER